MSQLRTSSHQHFTQPSMHGDAQPGMHGDAQPGMVSQPHHSRHELSHRGGKVPAACGFDGDAYRRHSLMAVHTTTPPAGLELPPMLPSQFCTFWAALDADFAADSASLDVFQARGPAWLHHAWLLTPRPAMHESCMHAVTQRPQFNAGLADAVPASASAERTIRRGSSWPYAPAHSTSGQNHAFTRPCMHAC